MGGVAGDYTEWRVSKLEAKVADLQKSVASLIQEVVSLRHAVALVPRSAGGLARPAEVTEVSNRAGVT